MPRLEDLDDEQLERDARFAERATVIGIWLMAAAFVATVAWLVLTYAAPAICRASTGGLS